MATFLLLHGAWHGGWCWRRVVPLLAQAGHRVYAPSLAGLGERGNDATPEIDLETHIRETCALLDFEDARDVIVVGNSYGGMVTTGVADRCAERVIRAVYLNGMIPRDGQSMMDLATETQRARCYEAVRRDGDGWRLPPFGIDVFGISDPADAAWVARRLVPHPFRTMEQPLRLTRGGAMPPRTLIYCTVNPTGNYESYAELARTEPRCEYHELAAGHDSMITAPQQVAALLLEAAQAR
jgi:pimeloyl-ACP methyl ester carboxylesterase